MADRSITQRRIHNALSETSHHQAIPEKVNSWIGGEGIGGEGGRPSFQDFEEHLPATELGPSCPDPSNELGLAEPVLFVVAPIVL